MKISDKEKVCHLCGIFLSISTSFVVAFNSKIVRILFSLRSLSRSSIARLACATCALSRARSSSIFTRRIRSSSPLRALVRSLSASKAVCNCCRCAFASRIDKRHEISAAVAAIVGSSILVIFIFNRADLFT